MSNQKFVRSCFRFSHPTSLLNRVTTLHCSVFATIKDDGSSVSGKHPCDRVCEAGAAPMECLYTFNVELYNTLSKACYDCPLNITDCDREHCISADGTEKGLITVNRWGS